MLTFKRINALSEVISRYNTYNSDDVVVVIIISFDLLSELRAKCVKSIWLKDNGEELFMGCKVIMSRESDYLAVAYLNEDEEQYHDIEEVKA